MQKTKLCYLKQIWLFLQSANLILARNSTKYSPWNGQYPKLQFSTCTWFSHAQSYNSTHSRCKRGKLWCVWILSKKGQWFSSSRCPKWWSKSGVLELYLTRNVQGVVNIFVDRVRGRSPGQGAHKHVSRSVTPDVRDVQWRASAVSFPLQGGARAARGWGVGQTVTVDILTLVHILWAVRRGVSWWFCWEENVAQR